MRFDALSHLRPSRSGRLRERGVVSLAVHRPGPLRGCRGNDDMSNAWRAAGHSASSRQDGFLFSFLTEQRMKRVLLGAAIAMGMMVFAAPALATTDPGFLEICKTSTGLTGTPSFTYHVSGHADVTVPNNSCSAPFTVPSGDVTVQEVAGSFYTVSSISTSPGSALISSNPKGSGSLDTGPNGTAVVSVAAGSDPSNVTIVNYTNIPVTGYIEVCKNNAPDAGLTGSFTFTITGNNAFSTTTTVPIGHCSLPILVPAGVVNVAEAAPNSITGITVQNGAPSSTLANGSENVTVKP